MVKRKMCRILLAAVWLVAIWPRPAEAVVPVLVGPLQVLLAMLPALLAALGGLVLALFKPAALKTGLKLLWRQKVCVLVMAAAIGGIVFLVQTVAPGQGNVVSPSEVTSESWPMFRGDSRRRAVAPESPEPTAGGVVWSYSGDAATFYSSPAVVGNRVYATSADKGVFTDTGAIYCLDADRGGVVWQAAPEGYRASFSSPAVSGKYLVCGEGLHFTEDARIVCLDVTRDGAVLWLHQTKSHVESSPCIYKNRVYVGAGDDGYYCLELEPDAAGAAKVVWHVGGDRYRDAESSPVVQDGKVYVGLGMDGTAVCCLDADTGAELWRTSTPYPVFAPPSLAKGKLFVGMGNGNFIESAEAAREEELAKLKADGKSEAELAEAAKRLGPVGEVWCLDAVTGVVEWRFRVGRTVLGAVVAGEDRLYFGSRDGHVYSLSHKGQAFGKWDARAPIVTSPALTANHVYVVTENGRLYGLGAAELKPVWEATVGTEGACLSSPTIARGHVYVGSSDGGLLCLGQPRDAAKRILWAGPLGGAGKPGQIDGSAIPERGSFSWRYPEPPEDGQGEVAALSVTAPAACLGGRLYVPVADGPKRGIVCLKHEPGARRAPAERWHFETANGVTLSPAASQEQVFAVDGKPGAARHLHAIDAEAGAARWRVPIASQASGQFALGVDFVLVQDQAKVLSRFDHAGKLAWRSEVGALAGPPAYEDAILVVASKEPPTLAAMDLETGKRLWRIPLAVSPTTGPAVQGNVIYVGTATGLHAYGLVAGKSRWRSEAGSVTGPFAVGRGEIAYVASSSEAVLLDSANGKVKARLPHALPAVPPILSRGAMLYASSRGLMHYDLSKGRSRRWLKISWLGRLSSPAIMADSLVYFATDKKGFICARGVSR